MRIEDELCESSSQPAEQVEQQIFEVAQIVFNVVPENPQEPHIADHMHPRAVQEHGSQRREKSCHHPRPAGSAQKRRDVGGHHAQLKEQDLEALRSEARLEKENYQV